MSIESVRRYFQSKGYDHRIMEFKTSSATVELAAQAVGCIPARIAKTLSFMLGEQCILLVTAGDAKVDNVKFKAQFGCKAVMPKPDQAFALIGHEVGGVCPFAVNKGIQTFLDVSLRRFESVYPACGSANSAIELTLAEMEALAGTTQWVDVCKAWEHPVGETHTPYQCTL